MYISLVFCLYTFNKEKICDIFKVKGGSTYMTNVYSEIAKDISKCINEVKGGDESE